MNSNHNSLLNPCATKDLVHAAGPSGLCNCDFICLEAGSIGYRFKNLGCRLETIRLMNSLGQRICKHAHKCLHEMTMWNHFANKFLSSFGRTISLLNDKQWQVFVDIFVFLFRFPSQKQQFNRCHIMSYWFSEEFWGDEMICKSHQISGWSCTKYASISTPFLIQVLWLHVFGWNIQWIWVEHLVDLGWTSCGLKFQQIKIRQVACLHRAWTLWVVRTVSCCIQHMQHISPPNQGRVQQGLPCDGPVHCTMSSFLRFSYLCWSSLWFFDVRTHQ